MFRIPAAGFSKYLLAKAEGMQGTGLREWALLRLEHRVKLREILSGISSIRSVRSCIIDG